MEHSHLGFAAGGFTYLKEQFSTISFKAYFPLIKLNPHYLLVASQGWVFKSHCVVWFAFWDSYKCSWSHPCSVCWTLKKWKRAGSSQDLLQGVYVMKCRSQLVVPAIFTPGALELWGCRWPNAGVISSMSLIIYMELITLGWQFLLTQNCRCTKETCVLNAQPLKRQRENGAALWGWLSSRRAPGKAMSFIATTGFSELTSNLTRWLTIATVAKVILLDSHRILFLICILQKNSLPSLLLLKKCKGWESNAPISSFGSNYS